MKTLGDLVDATESTLKVFSGGVPDLIPIGIPRLDALFGGLSPGNIALLGGDTGVGKTTIAIQMCLQRAKAKHTSAFLSTEDPEDVLGSRMLAYLSGVDTMRMRTANLTESDRDKLRVAGERLEMERHIISAFPTSRLSSVLKHLEEVCASGARLVFVDYLQNIFGDHRERRHDINQIFAEMGDILNSHGAAACVITQMRRKDREQKSYSRHDVKESGDVSNAARLILIAEKDYHDPRIVTIKVDKSTHGGEGHRAGFIRNGSGMLHPL